MGTRVKIISQIPILNLDMNDIRNSGSSASSSKKKKKKSFNGKLQFFDKEGSSDDQMILKGSVCQPSCLMDKAFISLFDDQELKISEGHFYGSLECISKIASRYVGSTIASCMVGVVLLYLRYGLGCWYY